MRITYLLVAAFALGRCSSASSESQGDASLDSVIDYDAFYQASYGLLGSQRLAAVAAAQHQTFGQLLQAVEDTVQNSQVVVGGISFRGMRDKVEAQREHLLVLDQTYASLGDYWRARGFDPATTVTKTVLLSSLSHVASIGRSAAELSLVDCIAADAALIGGCLSVAAAGICLSVQCQKANAEMAEARRAACPPDIEMQTVGVPVENPDRDADDAVMVASRTVAVPTAQPPGPSTAKRLKTAAKVAASAAIFAGSLAVAGWGAMQNLQPECSSSVGPAPAPAPTPGAALGPSGVGLR